MSTVGTIARTAYDLAFQISPIILKGGTFSSVNGQMLPIIALLGQLGAFVQATLAGSLSLDNFYARFVPIPGATVIHNSIGKYPFASQQVAANAIINEPLQISLMMIAPVKSPGGYLTKLAIFTSLRNSLKWHQDSGGTFHIATPSFIYTDCLLKGMTDITNSDTRQQQIEWQLDFEKPLVTQTDAQTSLNSLMSLISGGNKGAGSVWSGIPGSQSTGSPNIVPGLPGQVSEFQNVSPS